VIPERPFLWMTERQRQELRLQMSRIVLDFAAAIARARLAPRVVTLSRRRRLLGKLRPSGSLPAARLVHRCR
jgi:hypothetical protein